MSETQTSRRSTGPEPEPSPGSELTVCLWVVTALIAAFELTWWFFDRLYSI